MKEQKTRRYAVDFEHFENAMLVEANLGWQLYSRDRHKMSIERRQKVTAMLKRFVAEMKGDIEAHKTLILAEQQHPRAAQPNGDPGPRHIEN